jgi:hypothetical protein
MGSSAATLTISHVASPAGQSGIELLVLRRLLVIVEHCLGTC